MILAKDRRPPESLRDETLLARRVLEYEVWTRLHACDLAVSRGEAEAHHVLGLARPYDLAACDAGYLALAVRVCCPLVNMANQADRRPSNTVSGGWSNLAYRAGPHSVTSRSGVACFVLPLLLLIAVPRQRQSTVTRGIRFPAAVRLRRQSRPGGRSWTVG